MAEIERIAITGAAGNLGSLLSRAMLGGEVELNLLIHNKELPADIRDNAKASVFRIDLAKPETLCGGALDGVDTIVHFAGVLFQANPEKFLHTTNTVYFRNLLDAAVRHNVKRVVLISFPHVEGESTPEAPANGSLDGQPRSVHASTRLEEERLMFQYGAAHGFESVSLRVGMVYGKGILMIDAAQWFARHWLLGIWRKPTWIHLISTPDFLSATATAAIKPGISGIYHLGDEGVQTLQEFLDAITAHAGNHKPWRMPVWVIMTAARSFEILSRILGTRSPLTRDFIRIGMASYYGDTSRMRKELLPVLKYKNFRDGIGLF